MMEEFKAPLSFKVIFILNEIIFWLFGLVTVMAIIFSFLILAGVFKDDLQLHVNLPVAFDTGEIGYVLGNSTATNVQLVKAYGDIHFIDTPLYIARLYTIPLLIVTGAMFFLLLIFRKFIHNVRRGVIFETNNIKLLRYLAIGLLSFWMFWRLYDWLSGLVLQRSLHFGTISISTDTRSHNVLLISSLVLWVLSHIFMQGVKLYEESRLTI